MEIEDIHPNRLVDTIIILKYRLQPRVRPKTSTAKVKNKDKDKDSNMEDTHNQAKGDMHHLNNPHKHTVGITITTKVPNPTTTDME